MAIRCFWPPLNWLPLLPTWVSKPLGRIRNLKHVEAKVRLLGQRLDKIEDIGIPTGRFDLIFRNFLYWFDGSEKNIEFDSTSVEGLSLVKWVSK